MIYGGPDRWQELSLNKTSDQLVGVLLEEIAKASDSVEYFDGLVGANVVKAKMYAISIDTHLHYIPLHHFTI